MNIEDLENRVARLELALAGFSEELRLAYGHMRPDAASSLTKSRVILEKLAVQVYIAEMGREPRKLLLGEVLADNQFTRKVERRILSRMNAIRDMGNLGPHGEHVESCDAARVLDDICEVLEWYLQRYNRPKRQEDQAEHVGPPSQPTDQPNAQKAERIKRSSCCEAQSRDAACRTAQPLQAFRHNASI
jgi:hypothetical protein